MHDLIAGTSGLVHELLGSTGAAQRRQALSLLVGGRSDGPRVGGLLKALVSPDSRRAYLAQLLLVLINSRLMLFDQNSESWQLFALSSPAMGRTVKFCEALDPLLRFNFH